MRLTVLVVIAFLSTSLTAKTAMIESHWKTGDIIIDGIASEWSKPFSQLSDNENWNIKVSNDNDKLYLCFISTDKNINRQMMMFGFSVTFNGTQKNKDVIFGLRFPIGMLSNNEPHPQGDQNRDPETLKALEEQMLTALEIIGPNKKDSKPMGVTIADSFGIKVKCANKMDTLVYELEIPLKKGSAVTGEIELPKKSVVKVTFQTIEPDFSSEKMPPNKERSPVGAGNANAPRGDGMGGIMGGGNRPPSGRGPGRELDFSSFFKSELNIKLASDLMSKE
jgi:hypothetical protein